MSIQYHCSYASIRCFSEVRLSHAYANTDNTNSLTVYMLKVVSMTHTAKFWVANCERSCGQQRQGGTAPLEHVIALWYMVYGHQRVRRHLDLFADENRFSTAAGGCPATRWVDKAPDRSVDRCRTRRADRPAPPSVRPSVETAWPPSNKRRRRPREAVRIDWWPTTHLTHLQESWQETLPSAWVWWVRIHAIMVSYAQLVMFLSFHCQSTFWQFWLSEFWEN